MVRINGQRITALADELRPGLEARQAAAALIPQRPDPAEVTDRWIEATACRVIAVNAINFGSGYHDIVDKDPGLSGARTMAARFTKALEQLPAPISVEWFRSLSVADCAALFGQSLDNPGQGELMELFSLALRQLGDAVGELYDGSFTSLVANAEGSVERLANSLLVMPLYRDRASIDGLDVHFYKRAQITAADLARAFANRWPTAFGDLERLTAFADNLVPHVLRVDGVLDVDSDVVAAIAGAQQLPAGGRAEVELRAAGVVAVEQLTAALNQHPPMAGVGSIRAMDVDLVLWTRGAGARYKAIPRHRTRCAYY